MKNKCIFYARSSYMNLWALKNTWNHKRKYIMQKTPHYYHYTYKVVYYIFAWFESHVKHVNQCQVTIHTRSCTIFQCLDSFFSTIVSFFTTLYLVCLLLKFRVMFRFHHLCIPTANIISMASWCVAPAWGSVSKISFLIGL